MINHHSSESYFFFSLKQQQKYHTSIDANVFDIFDHLFKTPFKKIFQKLLIEKSILIKNRILPYKHIY